ncbi:MAG: hypothetical protein ABSA67_06205 [Candidatus Brocadiia bacterium]
MKNDTLTDVAAAINALVHGYKEEAQLYTHVRRLTWKQHDTLHEGWDLDQFHDLRDEKEDLLQMVEEIELGMRAARAVVLFKKPPKCPDRSKLDTLLDHMIEIIEEIWTVESDNASLLCAFFLGGGLSGVRAVSAGARDG